MSPISSFTLLSFFTISEKRIHCDVTVTKQVLINTTKNQKHSTTSEFAKYCWSVPTRGTTPFLRHSLGPSYLYCSTLGSPSCTLHTFCVPSHSSRTTSCHPVSTEPGFISSNTRFFSSTCVRPCFHRVSLKQHSLKDRRSSSPSIHSLIRA